MIPSHPLLFFSSLYLSLFFSLSFSITDQYQSYNDDEHPASRKQ